MEDEDTLTLNLRQPLAFWLALASGLLAIIGTLGPWVKVFLGSVSYIEAEDGKFVAASAAIALVLLMVRAFGSADAAARSSAPVVIGLLLALTAAAISCVDLYKTSSNIVSVSLGTKRALSVARLGWGAYLCSGAAVALTGFTVILLPRLRRLRASGIASATVVLGAIVAVAALLAVGKTQARHHEEQERAKQARVESKERQEREVQQRQQEQERQNREREDREREEQLRRQREKSARELQASFARQRRESQAQAAAAQQSQEAAGQRANEAIEKSQTELREANERSQAEANEKSQTELREANEKQTEYEESEKVLGG